MSKRKRDPDRRRSGWSAGAFRPMDPKPADGWADPNLMASLENQLRSLPRFSRDPFGVVNDWVRGVESISSLAIEELERLLQTGQKKRYDMRPVFDRTIFGKPSVRIETIEVEWQTLLRSARHYYHHQTALQRGEMRRHLYFDGVGDLVSRLLPDIYPDGLAPDDIVDQIRQTIGRRGTQLLDQRLEAFLIAAEIPKALARYLLQTFHRHPAQAMPWQTPDLEIAMMALLALIQTSDLPFEYIWILDPHARTGRALLAAAQAFPRWAVNAGLIRFVGFEADDLLLRVCRLNAVWHSLKGWFVDPAAGDLLLAIQPDLIVSDLGEAEGEAG